MNKPKLKKISTKGMSREEWLRHRKQHIGGSDAAAIAGLSPYSTAYTVWADKTGRLPEPEDNEAMRLGRDLEPYVVHRWQETTGKSARRENAILINPSYPFAHANVDRMVVGENAGLECKTTNALNLKRFKGGEYPANYYVQCVHYLAITGADRWYLAVLVLGIGFHTFVIERDEEEIAALMELEAEFWEHVETNTPPAADGETPTSDAIRTIYAECDGTDAIDLFGREALLLQYAAEADAIKRHEKEQERIKQILMQDLGEHTIGFCGSYKVTWKPTVSNRIDTARLRKEQPAVAAQYTKQTTTRTMRISAAE